MNNIVFVSICREIKPVKIDHIFDNYYIPGTLNKNYCSWLYNKSLKKRRCCISKKQPKYNRINYAFSAHHKYLIIDKQTKRIYNYVTNANQC